MKITLLPSTYYTDPTYHRVLSSLRRELSASGHEVTIASHTTAINPELQLEPEAGKTPSDRGARGQVKITLKPPTVRALAEFTPAGAVLNFHFSGWLRGWHAPLLLSGRLASARLVVTFQDYRHPDLPPLTPAARKTMSALLRRAHRVTAVSGFLARMIRADFPSIADKLLVIPNGTDISAGGALRRPERGYILTVGREAPYKGLDLLLFAFAKAVEKGCGEKLVVCGAGGRGPLRRLAEKLGIGSRVTFRGVVPPGELSTLMRNCLFYATTPRWESFGMAVLEAMSAGKAVLAARTGGLAEFARAGRNAALVAPKDVDAVSSAILRLSADRRLRNFLGREAGKTALKYSWTKIADKYIRSAYSERLKAKG